MLAGSSEDVTSQIVGRSVGITPSSSLSPLVVSSLMTKTTKSAIPEKCLPCRTPKIKRSFCSSDYAIHASIENIYMNSNNKPMYKIRIIKTYKTTQELPQVFSLRVLGLKCPCPYLETGKEYAIFGRLRTKKTGQLRVVLNRRSFVQEWSNSFEREVILLKKNCGLPRVKTTKISSKSSATPTKSTAIESTFRPPSITRMTTTQPSSNPCPECRLSNNLKAIYCSNDYAIRAKVTKYRLATNRTMYYAHVITTYKTKKPLPREVLIRVPGQRCPCPALEPGVEYLMIGSIKATFTGKQRLTLSNSSFVQKWVHKLDKAIDKLRCGNPVEAETTTITHISSKGPTKIATISSTTIGKATVAVRNVCPGCSLLGKSRAHQRLFCKSNQVFRGRVIKSQQISTNRTQYVISVIAAFQSSFELPNEIPARMADNACLCGRLAVGKEFLFIGRVKDKGSGRARMILTRRSYVQEWGDDLIGIIDFLRTQCRKSVMEVKIKETIVTRAAPLRTSKTTPGTLGTSSSETTSKETVIPTLASTSSTVLPVSCPHCQVSYNIQDFCSNEYVLRVRVIKNYHTSANRTVYHVGVKQIYKSADETAPIILLRVPGIECHCPKLRVSEEYVVMGLVKKRKRGPSIMRLTRGNFVQRWNEGFEEELDSLKLGCDSNANVGSFVHLISGARPTTSTPTSTAKTTKANTEANTMNSSSQPPTNPTSVSLLSTENKATPATPPKCPPCTKSKRRNKLYCMSDYVLAVQIQERVHNTTTLTTKYYATVQYKYKEYPPLNDVLITIIVRNDRCNCPKLKTNASYTLMANIEFIGAKGQEVSLILPRQPFVKVWSRAFHKKMLKLKGSCSTGHKRLL